MSKTVVFGPWIGELGWELNSWQGWVHHVMRKDYKDHQKIICSFPGRESLYAGCLQDCEYHSHPDWFCKLKYSPRAYATDYWWKDSPKFQKGKYNGPTMKPMAERLVSEISQEIGVPESNFVLPWKQMKYKKAIIGGVYNTDKRYPVFSPQRIPKSSQDILPLTPITEASELLCKIQISQGIDPESNLILMFPRNRHRGAFKNWPSAYYTSLSEDVSEKHPGYVWTVVGHPDQSLFGDKTPPGWLNLVNLGESESQRLNVHIAALSKSILGVGPASGIIHIATWCKVPVILNGAKRIPRMFKKDENPFDSYVACATVKRVGYEWLRDTTMRFMDNHGY